MAWLALTCAMGQRPIVRLLLGGARAGGLGYLALCAGMFVTELSRGQAIGDAFGYVFLKQILWIAHLSGSSEQMAL